MKTKDDIKKELKQYSYHFKDGLHLPETLSELHHPKKKVMKLKPFILYPSLLGAVATCSFAFMIYFNGPTHPEPNSVAIEEHLHELIDLGDERDDYSESYDI